MMLDCREAADRDRLKVAETDADGCRLSGIINSDDSFVATSSQVRPSRSDPLLPVERRIAGGKADIEDRSLTTSRVGPGQLLCSGSSWSESPINSYVLQLRSEHSVHR